MKCIPYAILVIISRSQFKPNNLTKNIFVNILTMAIILFMKLKSLFIRWIILSNAMKLTKKGELQKIVLDNNVLKFSVCCSHLAYYVIILASCYCFSFFRFVRENHLQPA